jgi:hypothetical protein
MSACLRPASTCIPYALSMSTWTIDRRIETAAEIYLEGVFSRPECPETSLCSDPIISLFRPAKMRKNQDPAFVSRLKSGRVADPMMLDAAQAPATALTPDTTVYCITVPVHSTQVVIPLYSRTSTLDFSLNSKRVSTRLRATTSLVGRDLTQVRPDTNCSTSREVSRE